MRQLPNSLTKDYSPHDNVWITDLVWDIYKKSKRGDRQITKDILWMGSRLRARLEEYPNAYKFLVIIPSTVEADEYLQPDSIPVYHLIMDWSSGDKTIIMRVEEYEDPFNLESEVDINVTGL